MTYEILSQNKVFKKGWGCSSVWSASVAYAGSCWIPSPVPPKERRKEKHMLKNGNKNNRCFCRLSYTWPVQVTHYFVYIIDIGESGTVRQSSYDCYMHTG